MKEKLIMVDVNVDDSLKCFAVHWSIDIKDAEKHFSDLGFVGIKDFKKNKVLNGNAARKKVVSSAKKQDAKWFFQGNYDWNVTDDSAIYEFNYSEFTGDLIDGSGDYEYAANWSGHK